MSNETTREPKLSAVASWAVLVASFGLSASTWIALAELAGFTGSSTIGGHTLKLAWLMPVSADGYLVVALVLWMSPVPAHIAAFARKNTYGSAAVGVLAQSAYHSLLTWSSTGVLWRTVMAALVGAIPPLFAGLAVHMRALLNREGRIQAQVPAPKVEPPKPAVPVQRVAPVMTVMPEAEEPTPAVPNDPPPAPAEPALVRTRSYPTSGYPMIATRQLPVKPVPDPEPEAEAEANGTRRPAEETRRMANEILAAEPDISQTELAARLERSTRYVRKVMNSPTPATNGAH